ncbi:DUF1778 domain-containing protein, partial [Dysosmobacter welbionis]
CRSPRWPAWTPEFSPSTLLTSPWRVDLTSCTGRDKGLPCSLPGGFTGTAAFAASSLSAALSDF